VQVEVPLSELGELAEPACDRVELLFPDTLAVTFAIR
jgi:hypothetical protein